jgi:hypothetical protein
MSIEYELRASPEQEAESLATELLRGVPMSEAERARARGVIRADVLARRAVEPVPGEPRAAWERGRALMAERDAALAALFDTEAQRSAFAANAAAHRAMLDALRREGGRRRAEHGPAAG